MKKLLSAFNTRVGLLSFIVFFVWVKSMIAYFGVFNLRGVGPAELLLMIINPIGFTALFCCFTYRRLRFLATLVNDSCKLLYLNILYYREFTDFITIDTMTGGAGMFQHGFDFGSVPVHLMDWVYWIDLVVIIVLLIAKKMNDQRPVGAKRAFIIFQWAWLVWFEFLVWRF
ncbi:hypothetical protein QK908_04160 [Lactococcus cremoris]